MALGRGRAVQETIVCSCHQVTRPRARHSCWESGAAMVRRRACDVQQLALRLSVARDWLSGLLIMASSSGGAVSTRVQERVGARESTLYVDTFGLPCQPISRAESVHLGRPTSCIILGDIWWSGSLFFSPIVCLKWPSSAAARSQSEAIETHTTPTEKSRSHVRSERQLEKIDWDPHFRACCVVSANAWCTCATAC